MSNPGDRKPTIAPRIGSSESYLFLANTKVRRKYINCSWDKSTLRQQVLLTGILNFDEDKVYGSRTN